MLFGQYFRLIFNPGRGVGRVAFFTRMVRRDIRRRRLGLAGCGDCMCSAMLLELTFVRSPLPLSAACSDGPRSEQPDDQRRARFRILLTAKRRWYSQRHHGLHQRRHSSQRIHDADELGIFHAGSCCNVGIGICLCNAAAVCDRVGVHIADGQCVRLGLRQ